MNPYSAPLIELFEANANPEIAPQMKAYMKNRFEFFGIKSPLRKQLEKQFLAENGEPDFSEIGSILFGLFKQPQRELHYSAIALCGRTKKFWGVETITLFEKLILTKSWWDSVDSINSVCLKPYFLKFRQQQAVQTKKWIESDSIWLRRVSLIFQLRYKEQTDTKLLVRNIEALKDSDEFFVQKAIGWILRDYAFTDPQWVQEFVNKTELKSLSRREALKHFKNQ